MARIEDILTVPIQLTDTLHSLAFEAGSYRLECAELSAKAERLAKLLRSVVRLANDATAGGPLYTRPLRRMLQELEKSAGKALALVRKCNRHGVIKRVITITSGQDFRRVNLLIENSIADITWFLNVSAVGENRDVTGGMPPIAASEPPLAYCWEQIALLYRGTEQEREDAAASLSAYAKNDKFAMIMVEEEAVAPLIKVLTDGTVDAKEAAARALGHMAKNESIIKQMIMSGLAPVFVKVLNNGAMKVQAAVAWALAEMVEVDREQQDTFLDHLAIRPLLALLGEFLEELTLMDPSMQTFMRSMAVNKMAVSGQKSPVNSVSKPSDCPPARVVQNNLDKPSRPSQGYLTKIAENGDQYVPGRPLEKGRGLTHRELYRKERETADPSMKVELKAEVARALWKLAKGNARTCKAEAKGLMCFATLMEKGSGLVQQNTVMAVMELAAVAETDAELRRTAFKMSSPAVKAVVNQLLRLVEEGSEEVQVACIKCIGCLSRTFPARETRVVKPLVRQLEGPEHVAAEAVKALIKFACDENFLHTEHSKAILEASGAAHLVQLILFGKGEVQIDAVTLMCYLTVHAGDNEELARAEPLPALKGFAKNASLGQCHLLENLLPHAINHLEIYHGRAPRYLSDSYPYE